MGEERMEPAPGSPPPGAARLEFEFENILTRYYIQPGTGRKMVRAVIDMDSSHWPVLRDLLAPKAPLSEAKGPTHVTQELPTTGVQSPGSEAP